MATAGSEPAGSDPDRRIIAGVPPPLRRPALRQRAALTLLLAVCAASSACSPGFRTVTISDPAAPSVITIAAAAGPQAHVTALRIRAAGSVDGNGTLELMLDGKPYRSARLSGAVSFEWVCDWYASDAEIRYRPDRVRSGVLNLRYRFETL